MGILALYEQRKKDAVAVATSRDPKAKDFKRLMVAAKNLIVEGKDIEIVDMSLKYDTGEQDASSNS